MAEAGQRWAQEGFARAMDGVLFEPVDAQRLRRRVFERVFDAVPGAPEPMHIGRYRVLERVGAGAMGVVYAAYDNQLDRKIAVKLLRWSVASTGAEARARMLREAKALGRLSHPNVVQVHDAGEWEGQVFVAMEFIRGRTLSAWLREQPRSSKEVIDVFVQAGAGLAAAHDCGIVHRDFKPENVLIGADGRVRVLDFGLAAAPSLGAETSVGDEAGLGELTKTGAVLGTPAYMAPEQRFGGALDHRADQYAFGVALYEALYGERPFPEDNAVQFEAAVMSGRLRPAPAGARVPTRIRRIVTRSLALEPDDRYPGMDPLLEALRARPSRRAWVGIGAVVLAMGIGVGGLEWAQRETDRTVETVALALERDAQQGRAESAEARLHEREDAAVIDAARLLLDRDPTRAIAKLRQLSADGWNGDALFVATSAAGTGVADHVMQNPDAKFMDMVGDQLILSDDRGTRKLWDVRDGYTWTSPTRPYAVGEYGTVFVAWAAGRRALIRDVTTGTTSDGPQIDGDVTSVEVDPHGRFIAARGSRDIIIHRIDGSRVGALSTRGLHPHTRFAVAPGGDALAVVDVRARLTQHDLGGRGTARVLGRGVKGELEYSADGRRLTALGVEGDLFVWDRFDRRLLLRNDDERWVAARIAPNGRFVLAWDSDRRARKAAGRPVVWDIDSGTQIWAGRSGGLVGSDARFAPDGERLVVSHSDAVELVDLPTGTVRRLRADEPGMWPRFLPDGRALTRHGDRRFRVWSPVGRLSAQRRAVVNPFAMQRLGHFTDQDTIVRITGHQAVERVDLATGTSIVTARFEPPPPQTLSWSRGAALSPSGHAAMASERVLEIYFPDGRTHRIDLGAGRRSRPGLAADGREIAWLEEHGLVRIDLESMERSESGLSCISDEADQWSFARIQLFPTLDVLSLSSKRGARLIGLERGLCEVRWEYRDPRMPIELDPEARYGMLSAEGDRGGVQVIDLTSGEPLGSLASSRHWQASWFHLLGSELLSDGRAVLGHPDGGLVVWDPRQDLRWRIDMDTEVANGIAVSPDESAVAAVTSEGVVYTFDLDQLPPLEELPAWVDGLTDLGREPSE